MTSPSFPSLNNWLPNLVNSASKISQISAFPSYLSCSQLLRAYQSPLCYHWTHFCLLLISFPYIWQNNVFKILTCENSSMNEKILSLQMAFPFLTLTYMPGIVSHFSLFLCTQKSSLFSIFSHLGTSEYFCSCSLDTSPLLLTLTTSFSYL